MALSEVGYFFFYVGWTPSLTSLPIELVRDPEGRTVWATKFGIAFWLSLFTEVMGYILKFIFSSLTSTKKTVICNVNDIGFKYTKIIAVGLRYTYWQAGDVNLLT